MKGIRLSILISVLFCSCRMVNPDLLVSSRKPRLPVLKFNEVYPVLMIRCDKLQSEPAPGVKTIDIDLSWSDDLASVDSVRIFYLESDSMYKPGVNAQPFDRTWPEENWPLLDEGNSRGYSYLTSIGENTIGILYEGSTADIVFESIPLKDVINSENQ